MRHYIRLTVVLFLTAFWTADSAAQGFDDLKNSVAVSLNAKLKAIVDKGDVHSLEKILSSKPETLNQGSNIGINDKGAQNVVPLFNDLVNRALTGDIPMEMCKIAINNGIDPYSVYNGKTPIYQIMDFLATTPIEKASTASQVLDILISAEDFDINRRYRSYAPPLSYLLSTNYSYLGGRYSAEYISSDIIIKMIESGARLNSYDENGGSLLLLANSTNDTILKDYLLNNGVNIEKAADNSGNNALYAAIESNDLNSLKTLVANYSIKIETGDVQSKIGGMIPEVYDFIAGECASYANTSKSYDEIVAFQNCFKDKKELVQKVYESIALYEIANANDHSSITRCYHRFPDFKSTIEMRRRKIAEKEFAMANSFETYELCSNYFPDYLDLINSCRNRLAEEELKNINTISNIKTFESHYPSLASKCLKKKMEFYNAACEVLKTEIERLKVNVSNRHLISSSFPADSFLNDFEGYYDPENAVPLVKAVKTYEKKRISIEQTIPFSPDDLSDANMYLFIWRNLGDAVSSGGDEAIFPTEDIIWMDDILRQKSKMCERYQSELVENVKKIENFEVEDIPRYTSNIMENVSYLRCGGYEFDVSFATTSYILHVNDGRFNGKTLVACYDTFEHAIIAGYCAARYGYVRHKGHILQTYSTIYGDQRYEYWYPL